MKKLSKLTLKLIQRDLKRISGMIDNGPPGMYALTLTRYFAAIMGKEKSQEKFEDEIRRKLKSMSEKQLRELAGVETEAASGKVPPK